MEKYVSSYTHLDNKEKKNKILQGSYIFPCPNKRPPLKSDFYLEM